MKFAFIIMGEFDSIKDRASIHNGTSQIIGVSTIEEACTVSCQLVKEGIACIELCGAFEESGAKKIIEATENKIPIGYITHLNSQNELFDNLFN